MRSFVLLGLVILMLLPAAAATAVGPPVGATGEVLAYTGRCTTTRWNPGETWVCYFSGDVRDLRLIFFRWDFDGDGHWDTIWITSQAIYYTADGQGVRRICLQGWDGVAYRDDQPAGPVYCRRYALGGGLTIVPRTWDRNSTSPRVFAIWDVLPVLRPIERTLGHSFLCAWYCVPVILMTGGGDPAFRAFRAERAAVTRAFGPGVHYVELVWEWDDPMNTTVISLPSGVEIR